MSALLYLQQAKQTPHRHLRTTFVGFRVTKSIKVSLRFTKMYYKSMDPAISLRFVQDDKLVSAVIIYRSWQLCEDDGCGESEGGDERF
jgi:hypothetical protein